MFPSRFFYFLRQEERPVLKLILLFQVTNRLIVTPIHDAYLENGTYEGLTVGDLIIAYEDKAVNILIHLFWKIKNKFENTSFS